MFTESIKQQNWDEVYQDDDIKKGFELVYSIFKKLHDSHFPLQKFSRTKSKNNSYGWQKNLINAQKPNMKIERKVNEGNAPVKLFSPIPLGTSGTSLCFIVAPVFLSLYFYLAPP